ncbi:uncharacterized protein LOC101473784 isoform X2 [Maylandia zebra]|uniref:uncharacterized protein LOC101473784 isoform X2 n=1 Tax=Maylandia zebra TaxID=106582 RepID=UPI00403C0238
MNCEEEEGVDDQQVCNQERNSSLNQNDPEPPQIKEEQEEVCTGQEAEGIIVWTGKERLRLLDTIWKPEIKLHRIGKHKNLDSLQVQSCLAKTRNLLERPPPAGYR